MKKIGLVLLIASIWFVSCGERYEEDRGQVFEGTWKLVLDSVGQDDNSGGHFITVRELEGENVLLFYSRGLYDSSFVFRFQEEKYLYVNRIWDAVKIVEYYLSDSKGSDSVMYRASMGLVNDPNLMNEWTSIEELLKKSDKKYKIVDTVIEVQKPIHPYIDNYTEEAYYGECSFREGKQPTLVIERKKSPTDDKVYARDIYTRPEEKE
jgi:hypothetical protein